MCQYTFHGSVLYQNIFASLSTDGLVSDLKHQSGFAALPLGVSSRMRTCHAEARPRPRAEADAIIRTHMPKSVPDSVPESDPKSVPTSVPRSVPRSDPSKVVCERCGAE